MVELTPEEREQLEALTCKGTVSARRMKRALVLLAADEGDKDTEIAAKARGTVQTVELNLVESISDETVRRTLKKGLSKRGSVRNGALPA